MPNFVAPGVYVIEKDISDYPDTINSSVVGLVGFASKGPTNKATLITSQQSLVDTFGKPSEDIYGQGLEGAVEILEATDTLYYVRAASEDAADASAQVAFGSAPGVIIRASGVNGAGGTGTAVQRRWGIDYPLTLQIQVYDKDGVKKFPGSGKIVTIPSGTLDPADTSSTTGKALRKALGADNDNAEYGLYSSALDSENSPSILASFYAGSAAYMDVTAVSGTSFNLANGVSALQVLGPTGEISSVYGNFPGPDMTNPSSFASSVRVWGTEFKRTGENSLSYLVESLWPGAGYNAGTTITGATSGNSVEISKFGGANTLLQINEDGFAQENFKVSPLSGASFIETQINTGETDLRSRIIKGNIVSGIGDDLDVVGGTDFSNKLETVFSLPAGSTGITGGYKFTFNNGTIHTVPSLANINPRLVKAVQGTYNLAGGDNGIPSTDDLKAAALIGDATSEPKTGMQVLDNDVLNISIGAVPGVNLQSVQNALITLAEQSQNFFAVVSPPYGIGGVQNAVDWHNGLTLERTASINNNYAGIYWPWVQMFSVFDKKDRWMDPAIFAIRQIVYTDSVSEPWFAPAGVRRGRLTKPIAVEVNINNGDIKTMYSGGNSINPIINLPQTGIVIWGQRTAQRNPTALDRINIRRLLIYIRKVLLLATQRFMFEPNDQFLWEEIENVVNPLLDDIANRRGITEFKVRCDETTNTPVRVDRNELWCKVIIKPTKAAEILVFELNITNQSADLGKL